MEAQHGRKIEKAEMEVAQKQKVGANKLMRRLMLRS